MNRKHLIMIAVVALVALAGCSNVESGSKSADELAENTGEDFSNVTVGGSYWYEAKLTEKNQYGLVQSQAPFTMDWSLERANLIERYKYLNDRSNVHHVYLMSNDGKVISYSVAQGKVSSVNSKLTNDKQIVVDDRCLDTTHNDAESGCFKVVESPQMDGSYGSNGDAIFWFTTDGHYMEWNGLYVVSEEPKNIQTAMTLVDVEGSETQDDQTPSNDESSQSDLGAST